MPFKQKTIHFKAVQLHILTFDHYNPTDYIELLTPQEFERFSGITSLVKQQQFVATRYLRHQLVGLKHIQYTDNGAPYIENEAFISISHSNNMVGIATSKEFQVGLDIEMLSGKAKKVHLKFLNEEEQANFDCTSDKEMIKVWSAKETLYKMANRNGIDFKKELLLSPIDETSLLGKIIHKSGVTNVEIHTFVYENFMITLNHSKVQHVQSPHQHSRDT